MTPTDDHLMLRWVIEYVREGIPLAPGLLELGIEFIVAMGLGRHRKSLSDRDNLLFDEHRLEGTGPSIRRLKKTLGTNQAQ